MTGVITRAIEAISPETPRTDLPDRLEPVLNEIAPLPDFLRAPPYSQMKPRSAMRSVIAWSVKYGVQVILVGDRPHGNAMLRHLLEKFWRYRNGERHGQG